MSLAQMRFSGAFALLAAFVFTPATAEAQFDITCNVGTVTSPMWVACSGAWAGNDSGASNLLSTFDLIVARETWTGTKGQVYDNTKFEEIFPSVAAWNRDYYGNYYLGTSGDPDSPFQSFTDDVKTATLTLKYPYAGIYVLILKGGIGGDPGFYMYLMDFRSGVLPIQIMAAGVGQGGIEGYDISHVSLWGEYATVPEPSSLLLLGSGLLGLGFVGYRRRRK